MPVSSTHTCGDSPSRTDLWSASLQLQTRGLIRESRVFPRSPTGRLVCDLTYLTGMTGEAGIFLTRCWLQTDQEISKTLNHLHVLSWVVAPEEAVLRVRVDLCELPPCCQCGEQAAR